MGRQELHTDSIAIEQKAPILDQEKYEGDIVRADSSLLAKDYTDELAFNEEPVTIRLEPSSEKNAANAHGVWVNGKGAEVFQNGQWMEIGYLPVGRVLITKRKYLAILLGAKFDRVETVHEDATVEKPRNTIARFTSAVQSLSIIEDRNPKGAAWVQELRRRNM